MADVREQILERMQAVVGAVAGVKTAVRNKTEADDTQLPLISVLEGDEDAQAGPKGRNSTRPYVVTATPQIFIRVGSNTPGQDLNAIRLAVMKAIPTDAQLSALTLNDRGIRYAGMQSTLHAGRTMIGAMALVFTLTYLFDPNDI